MADTIASAFSPFAKSLVLEREIDLSLGFMKMIHSMSVTSATVGESHTRLMARGVD